VLINQLQFHDNFGSGSLVQKRNIVVYLPPDYQTAANKRFPVLYMHDGQNLFNPQTAFANVAWKADETAQNLILANKIQPLIIVGIYNTGDARIDEYTPIRGFRGRGGQAENYGKMIVEELKPFIDSNYNTLPNREFTGIGGSSLGGLVSLYFGLKYPQIFSRLALISPALWWNNLHILQQVRNLQNRIPLRIWLDIGNCEGVNMKRQTQYLNHILLEKGWTKNRTAKYADFRYLEVPKASHNEFYWGNRFDKVLKFLYPIV
jgi:predicted alpha/beta superfamily hydrolase